MRLKNYCTDITQQKDELLKPNTDLGLRIMCPEYSIDSIDVKTFPLSEKEDIFILCWNMEVGGKLHAAIKPYHPTFTYDCEFTPGGRTQFHTHDYIELAYIVEGEFKQRIMGNDILFKKGELCLIDKNCPHQDFLADSNSIILFIGLGNEIFDLIMEENIGEEKLLNFLRTALMKQKDIRQYLHFKPKDPEDIKLEELLLCLLSELERNDAAAKYICKGLIIRILHYISSMYDFSLSNEQRKKMNWLIYEEITRYIEDNYATITVKELVSKFHFNEDYYNRILKEKLGMTYLEYVQSIRLKNAYQLIKTTKMTVDEVAVRVGYQNKGYFYKIFVQKYGITPAKLRK
jgi:AraC-like DNA-binding protein/mannose-6-phosphate isomerase-like protein (cupin superfamily)